MGIVLSMLRGINVSGQKKVPMVQLKKLYEDLGFTSVRTYIQSGNVLFEAGEIEHRLLPEMINTKIQEVFGFDVQIIIRTRAEMEQAIWKNPYVSEQDADPGKLYVTFLAEEPTAENLEKIKAYNFDPEKFSIIGKEAYLYVPLGYGNAKLSNTFFENKLKVQATTRNWKSVNTLADLLKAE